MGGTQEFGRGWGVNEQQPHPCCPLSAKEGKAWKRSPWMVSIGGDSKVPPHTPATSHPLGRREEAQDRPILDLVPKIDGGRQSPSWGTLSPEPRVTNLKKFPSFFLFNFP